MSLYEVLTITTCFLTAVLCLISWAYSRRLKEFEQSRDKAEINSHRAQIEKRLYSIQDSLLDDAYNFVDSNKLLIKFATENSFDSQVPNYSFFTSLGINFAELNTQSDIAFCLMPFHKQYIPLYTVIKTACHEMGINCHRSDESYEPGNLLRQIIKNIISARYIFAVLDGRNSNVFYEIGIAHSLGKPVFLIANFKEIDKLPFDISSSRLILYRSYKDLENSIFRIIQSNRTYEYRGQEENSLIIGAENQTVTVSNVQK